jgi:small subunit ribosomal protein S16
VVRIRLRRIGAKKKPFYRVVVANQQNSRDGRFIETIGTYNPLTDPPTVELKTDRAAHWLSHGAQPSDAVLSLLKREGIVDGNGKLVSQPESASPVATEAEGAAVSS